MHNINIDVDACMQKMIIIAGEWWFEVSNGVQL